MSTKPVKCRQTLAEYAERFPYCQACGIPGERRQLHIHHLVKRGRSDERCNLLRLCWVCHNRAEAQGQRIAEWITLGTALAIKLYRDPGGWDAGRLTELFLKTLPDLLPIPSEFTAWEPAQDEEMPY